VSNSILAIRLLLITSADNRVWSRKVISLCGLVLRIVVPHLIPVSVLKMAYVHIGGDCYHAPQDGDPTTSWKLCKKKTPDTPLLSEQDEMKLLQPPGNHPVANTQRRGGGWHRRSAPAPCTGRHRPGRRPGLVLRIVVPHLIPVSVLKMASVHISI
jgi:hypothetical protein